MARHFLPWSTVLDAYQLWQSGNWNSAPSPQHFPASLLEKKNEKVSHMVLSDLSKYNSQLLSTGIANRFCDEPGKRAVLNTTSSTAAFLDIHSPLVLKVASACRQPQSNVARAARRWGLCCAILHIRTFQSMIIGPSQSHGLPQRAPGETPRENKSIIRSLKMPLQGSWGIWGRICNSEKD